MEKNPQPKTLDRNSERIRAEAVEDSLNAALACLYESFDAEGHTADLGNLLESPWSPERRSVILDSMRIALAAAFDEAREEVDKSLKEDAAVRELVQGIPAAAQAMLAATAMPSACAAETFEEYGREVARLAGDNARSVRTILQAVIDNLPAE